MSLSSTCLPVAHEDEGLHADYVVNSDVMLILMLSNLVFHLKLCVLAIDPGTSTNKAQDQHL
jgi:hypothetical protein